MKLLKIVAMVGAIVTGTVVTATLEHHYRGLLHVKECSALLMQYRDTTYSYIETLDNNTFDEAGYGQVLSHSKNFLRECNALHPFHSYTADLTWHWTEIYQDLRAAELRMIQRND